MYIPKANEETRIPVMHQLIRDQPLAALVTMGTSGLLASHIPMVLHAEGSEFGILRSHISRANPQWRDLSPNIEALAIFAGPHHYISPTWYPAKQEHGKVVPTWNYATVHAYGSLQIINDPAWLMRHLESLTTQHEAAFPLPWKIADAPPDYVATLVNGIVGFELSIRKLEGKWKLSQNRSDEDRQGVANGLTELNTPEANLMKDMVEAALQK